MENNSTKPDYIFEVSWEVCNKVGGIHTVISTKAKVLSRQCKQLILIGPDVWRETRPHPEFIKDTTMFSDWYNHAANDGLRVRTGRWNIPGNPLVLLVDFSKYINQKNKILTDFWHDYKLESLTGGWDYIEPVLFGYGCGKVIESFVKFNFSSQDKVIAHFHEWMTGSGVLYLKKEMPEVGTAFTTHATAIGRSIAANRLPLYKNLSQFNGDFIAKDFNITAKHSMEKTSGRNADVFTTVSEITARECSHLLKTDVDIVTPNGFENDFVPQGDDYAKQRQTARQKLIKVAETLHNYQYDKEPVIVATSGRYEFYNKGYDLFVDALGKLNKDPNLQKEVLAYILVPAHHYGPQQPLVKKLESLAEDITIENNLITHNLHELEHDPIVNRIKENELFNRPEDKVKIVFVPSYVDGDDGVFNLRYYEILTGIDVTGFISYYEPWGYTPLESAAFSIPTITTNLAGFGRWMQSILDEDDRSIEVIERDDDNAAEVVDNIVAYFHYFFSLDDKEVAKLRSNAARASEHALWLNLIGHYNEAYREALHKVKIRRNRISAITEKKRPVCLLQPKAETPHWRKFEVKTVIPERFEELMDLAINQWWTWNYEASELFKYIEPSLWRKHKYNPITFLEEVPYSRMVELGKNPDFIEKYEEVCKRFSLYMQEAAHKQPPKIAYFSMEYGFNDNIKIFSGGLGILAGDYIKEASDTNTDIVAIGLLYKYGYFKQKITITGEQEAEYIPQSFDKMPIFPVRDKDGSQKKIKIIFPGRSVDAKIWEVKIGRICLYLLDTDIEENNAQDRVITAQLYGGGSELRLKQEVILGIGGIRALDALGITPDVYHCNEGHVAFIGLERLMVLCCEKNLRFDEAMEVVRASTLFTTHTPVPAGHDEFDESLIRKYMAHYPERLKISWQDMVKLGQRHPGGKFSMSRLAANIAQEINGVSKLHGKVSREMFAELWPGYFADENHIGYVTNGVHYYTWTAKSWKILHEREFPSEFSQDQANPQHWRKIHNVNDSLIWKIRQRQRSKLINYIKNKIKNSWVRRYEHPENIIKVMKNLDDNALTIGFARRFATYKRGDLILRDLQRLSRILNNPDKPVQLLFAGKAHPNDRGGQEIIRKIMAISKQPEFLGKIIFVEDYDISLAKKLVQGVDIWLNTPTRLQEASGTSGMKAVMNGALHFSVLDGWWVEGFRKNGGWALPASRTYENQDFQDELDSQRIYSLLENEIVPLYYKRGENNIPHEWIKYIKNSIAEIAPHFTCRRMIDDYKNNFYQKLYNRSVKIKENDYALAREIASWKEKIKKQWDRIEVLEVRFPDYEKSPISIEKEFSGEITLDLNQVKPEDIGVELVISKENEQGEMEFYDKCKAELVEKSGNIVRYRARIKPQRAGFYNYGVRVFATNPNLPYPQDGKLIMWV